MSQKLTDILCVLLVLALVGAFFVYQSRQVAACHARGGMYVRKETGGYACIRGEVLPPASAPDHAPTLEEMGQADERGVTP
jgi:hypothetical protein